MFAGINKALLLNIMASSYCLITIDNPAHAQNSDAIQVVPLASAAEFIDEHERISGGAAVGVTFHNPDRLEPIKLDAAFVHFEELVTDPVQIQLATVDGRFLATFVHKSPPQLSGWVQFELTVSDPDFLDDYEPREIAVLVTRAGTDAIYPVRWGTRNDTETIRILLNSEESTSYFAITDPAPAAGKKPRPIPKYCEPVSQRSSFKFDRICDVPIADLDADNSIAIMRKRGADFGRSIDVKFALDGL